MHYYLILIITSFVYHPIHIYDIISKGFCPFPTYILIHSPLLPLVYFQRKLWCKHLHAPHLWSWRLPHLQIGGHAANHFVNACGPREGRGWKDLRTQGNFWENSESKVSHNPNATMWSLPITHLPFPKGIWTRLWQGHAHNRKSPIPQDIRLTEPVLLEVTAPNCSPYSEVSGVLCVISLAQCYGKQVL